MDIFLYFRPKNFQVHEMFRVNSHGDLIPVETLQPGETGYVDYFFGGKLYRHIGTWPIRNLIPRFQIPTKFAFFVDDETETPVPCTDIVKKYQGPTESQLSFDEYVPRPHFSISFQGGFRISMGIKWVLKKKVSGTVHVLNVLGQKSHIVV